MRRRARLEEPVFDRPGAAGAKLEAARAMRALPTTAEATMWAALRGRRLGGWKFRRQHVIAGYVVDFYCPALWLALEVDGGVHRDRRVEDREREDHLTSLGVRVVRFCNEDVLERLDVVLDVLAHRCEELATTPGIRRSPSPAPRGRDR
jgi:very-short-patch-repair endonuclease